MKPIFLLIVLAAQALTGCASHRIIEDHFIYKTAPSPGIDYMAMVPGRGEGPFPVVFAFPGRGQTIEHYLDQWFWEADGRPLILIFPAWERGQTLEAEEFQAFVNAMLEKYPADSKKVFLAGSSAGAFLVRHYFENQPERWKGLILIASSPSPWWQEFEPEKMPPVLFVHGAKDSQFPVDAIRRVVAEMKGKGYLVELREDVEGGHGHTPEQTSEMIQWILKGAYS